MDITACGNYDGGFSKNKNRRDGFMKIKAGRRNRITGGVEGTVNRGEYSFNAKVYETSSKFGVHNGKVSKMGVRNEDGELIARYDRGWDIEPKTSKDKMTFYAIIDYLDSNF